MKTDDLIQKLASDLKPVRSMPSPYLVSFYFAVAALLMIMAAFFLMEAREDLTQRFAEFEFLLELALSFVLAVVAFLLATVLARPGRDSASAKLEKITGVFLAICVGYYIAKSARLEHSQFVAGFNLDGFECFACVLGYAGMLGAGMFFWLRKGASTSPVISSVAIAVASVAYGTILISMFCDNANRMHILLWHLILPVSVGIVISSLIGRRVLRW